MLGFVLVVVFFGTVLIGGALFGAAAGVAGRMRRTGKGPFEEERLLRCAKCQNEKWVDAHALRLHHCGCGGPMYQVDN